MLPTTRFEKCKNGKTGVDERCRDAGRGGDAEGTPQSIGEPNGERPFCLHHCQYHHYHCHNYPHRGAVLIFWPNLVMVILTTIIAIFTIFKISTIFIISRIFKILFRWFSRSTTGSWKVSYTNWRAFLRCERFDNNNMMGKLFTAWWRAGEQDGNVEHEVGDGVDVGDGLAHPAAQGQRQLHSAGEAGD